MGKAKAGSRSRENTRDTSALKQQSAASPSAMSVKVPAKSAAKRHMKSTAKSAAKPKRNPRPPKSARYERKFIESSERPGVSITLQIPSLRRPQPRVQRSSSSHRFGRFIPRSRRLRLAAAAALMILAVGIPVVHNVVVKPKKVESSASAVRTQPSFKPLMPSDGQDSASVFDGKRDMVTYASTFSGARLTVSQQPLPQRIVTDPAAISTVADSIHAKQRLDTTRGPLYIATTDSNDQFAVYASKQVLLFIHSDRKLDDVSWKSFIELLRTK